MSYAGPRPLDGSDLHPRSFLVRSAHADPAWPPLAGLEAWCEADGVTLQPGERLEAEPLLVVTAPDGLPVRGCPCWAPSRVCRRPGTPCRWP
ncbi:MAG TPA: hypothetical protein VD902_07025 [Symbiobacteriaceae bacterium]|nr:hypothetical protein [Symbiobacteriaceae bacterium]